MAMLSISAMPKYESYRSTSIVWISELPQTWRVEKGKWLFVRAERPVRSKDEIVTCFRDGTVTLRKNRRTEGFTNALKEHGYQGIRKGDLVIHAMDAFAGAIGVSDSDGKSTPVYAACIPRQEDEVNPEFYAYFLRDMALSGFITSLAKGIRERSTDFRFNDFADLELPAPSLDEQDRIAKFLDKKATQIDEAIAIKEQQIALLKERKQIIIQKAVTQGLDPNVPMKDSGVDLIGEIPAHWEVVKFKYLANVRYGLGQPPKTLDGGLKIIRATNVERGKIVEKSMLYVDPSDIPWDRNPELREGEIIVVRSGAYTGDSALVTKEYDGAIAGYDMVATPLNCCPAFLGNALLSKYVLFDQIYLLRMRSAQPHLNAEELNELLIAVPPENEQEKIVGYLNYIDFEFEKSLKIFIDQIEKLKEYKTTLINSAVTGKIKITPDMVEG